MERKAHRLVLAAGISEMLLAIVGFAVFEWVIYLFFWIIKQIWRSRNSP